MTEINKIYIKNMVCPRCITSVEGVLNELGYHVKDVKLGEAAVEGKIDLSEVKQALEKRGFELLEDKNSQLAEKVKTEIISIIHHENISYHQNLSDTLSARIGIDYHILSHTFSAVEGITIEKFYILQRIEKVKELLQYNQHSLKEIAYQLGFSSVAHLSAQFKKETGLSPKQYKESGHQLRKHIHDII